MITNILLNIPHDSTITFYDEWNSRDLKKEVMKWADLFTAKLFMTNESKNIKSVVGNVSRFVCDFERLENDPLEEIGQGIIYTKFNGFERIIPEERKQKIMKELYYPYIEKVKNSLNVNSLLIDCHSFPTEVAKDIDINFGYNDDWSKPSNKIIDLVLDHFKGYKVGVNTPYGNSFSPKTDFVYPSIMIEINKKLYLSNNNEFRGDAYKFHFKIVSLYRKILKEHY